MIVEYLFLNIVIFITILIIMLCLNKTRIVSPSYKLQNFNTKDIIIVGNAPTTTKKGNFIDSFGCVVRFNGFELQGYEEYVGRKTTDWFLNTWVYKMMEENNFKNERMKIPNKYVSLSISNEVNSICFKKKKIKDDFIPIPSYNNANFFPREIDKKYYDGRYLKVDGHCYPYYPSTGLLAIFYYLDMVEKIGSNAEIHVIGFNNFDEKQKYHYYSLYSVKGKKGEKDDVLDLNSAKLLLQDENVESEKEIMNTLIQKKKIIKH